jgi:DNA-binding NarL/FixJ family response regulator
VRVLVVDHSESIRRRLRELLREGSAVDVIDTGDTTQALALAGAPVDVVLLDIAVATLASAPRAGLDLLVELRRRAPAATLIVLTNHSSDAHRDACCMHGADHFFDKSRDFEAAVRVTLQLAERFSRSSASSR